LREAGKVYGRCFLYNELNKGGRFLHNGTREKVGKPTEPEEKIDTIFLLLRVFGEVGVWKSRCM